MKYYELLTICILSTKNVTGRYQIDRKTRDYIKNS